MKAMPTEQFANIIVEYSEKYNTEVITGVDEVGDNFGMSVEVDEKFIEMFNKEHTDFDFEESLNEFFKDAINNLISMDKEQEMVNQ